MRNMQQFVVGPAGSEVAAVLVMMMLVGLFTAPLALFADAKVTANGQAPVNPCEGQIIANSTTQTANQVKVSDASGQGDSLDVYTGRAGAVVQRVSTPLSVQNGLLPPNLCLGTVVSDLVRSDGEVIPSDQVTSWAVSGNAGLRIFIYIEVSPRYGVVTPAGGYTGTVSMDDERAVGGNIPVNIHVEYPRLWRAAMVCIAAAWVGFFWAWLIHLTRADIPTAGRFWLYVILQLAILTIVSFPVLNNQILSNPDWTGDVSQYIALASLAGGGALAMTPTLRALVDRAAIFMPGASPGPSPRPASWSPAAATGTTAPTAPQGAPAGGAPGTNGDGSAGPAGTNGGTSAGPTGTNGDTPAVPTGTNGGTPSGAGAPAGPNDGTSSGPSAASSPADGTSSGPSAPGGPDDGSPSGPSAPPGPDDGTPSGPSAPPVPAGAPAGPAIPISPSDN
jgi:hypothetical protein